MPTPCDPFFRRSKGAVEAHDSGASLRVAASNRLDPACKLPKPRGFAILRPQCESKAVWALASRGWGAMDSNRHRTKLSAAEIRQDARRLLDEITATLDRDRRRRLAVRAFELAQLAEQIDYESGTSPPPPAPDFDEPS
jgi:hypothetical protein